MGNKLTRLIELLQRLPEYYQDANIAYLSKKVEESDENEHVPSCPHCRSGSVTKFGRVHNGQRYRCKKCGKILYEYHTYRHAPVSLWRNSVEAGDTRYPCVGTA
jgi:transposase-like protein